MLLTYTVPRPLLQQFLTYTVFRLWTLELLTFPVSWPSSLTLLLLLSLVSPVGTLLFVTLIALFRHLSPTQRPAVSEFTPGGNSVAHTIVCGPIRSFPKSDVSQQLASHYHLPPMIVYPNQLAAVWFTRLGTPNHVANRPKTAA